MDNKFEYRQYQEYILNRLRENHGINILVELDCGLGKRFITFQLVQEYFPNLRFLLIMQSSSSLDETVQYLSHDYGGISGLGWITSNMPFPLRKKILEEKRVIICTPMILSNILQGKGRGIIHAKDFDAFIINEIDTIIRRVSDRVVLTHPWNFLLPFFSSIWIIGMRGTLRDDHVVINEDQLKIRKELHTLKNYLKGTT